MNFANAMALPDKAKDGNSKEGIRGILEAMYKEALKKGYSSSADIEKLEAYKSFKYHRDESKLFTEGGTKKSKDKQDTEDTYDKGTLLAMIRNREIELDKMKRLSGYRGTRKVTTDEQYKNPADNLPGGSDYVAPTSRTKTEPFKADPKGPLNFAFNHDFTKPQTDAFGMPFKPAVPNAQATPSGYTHPDLLKLDTAMATGMFANKVPDDPYAITAPKEKASYVKEKEAFNETLNKTVPIIQKQRETIINSRKMLDKAYTEQINSVQDEKVKQKIQKSYSDQVRMLDDNLTMLGKYKGVEAIHSFNTSVDSVYSRAVGRDKDGNAIIPNQSANWNNLTQSFNGSLKAIIDHEKKQGNLSSEVDEQSVLDHVLSGRSLYHSVRDWFTPDEYDNLSKKYSPLFDKYKESTENIRTLHNQYLAEGGGEKETRVPVVAGKGTGVPFANGTEEMSGVVVPKDKIKWGNGGGGQIIDDLYQGAAEQVFNPLGKIASTAATLFGASYQTGEAIEQGFNEAGSRTARAASGVVKNVGKINAPLQIAEELTGIDVTGGNARGNWKKVVDLFSGAWGESEGKYVSPTMSALSGVIKGTAITHEQRKLGEETDSATRDIVQATANLVSGMTFGDFNAAGKIATGMGKGLEAVGLARKTVDNYNDAVTTSNRLMELLEKEPILGKGLDGLVSGTQQGRNAMLLAKSMLPINADIRQAAHLATTMAIQHVAQHADNLTDEKIVDGIRTGTLFGVMNVGFSKMFGGIAQRFAVNAKSSASLGVGEVAEKAERYKRIATVLSQIATQPAQTKISEAMQSGDWSKVFDPEDYMNRQTVIDMIMGGLDIKHIMHSIGTNREHAKQMTDLYESTIERMAYMKDVDGAVADYHQFMKMFESTALVHVPKVEAPSFDRAFKEVPFVEGERALLPGETEQSKAEAERVYSEYEAVAEPAALPPAMTIQAMQQRVNDIITEQRTKYRDKDEITSGDLDGLFALEREKRELQHRISVESKTEAEFKPFENKLDAVESKLRTASLLRKRVKATDAAVEAGLIYKAEAVKDRLRQEAYTEGMSIADSAREAGRKRAEAEKFKEAELVMNASGELVTKQEYIADFKSGLNKERKDAAPKTEMGTPIVPEVTPVQDFVDGLDAQQIPYERKGTNNIELNAQDVVASLKNTMQGDELRSQVLELYEKHLPKDVKVLLTDQPMADGKPTTGAYHEATNTVFLKKGTEGTLSGDHTAMHELHHAVFNERLANDDKFRFETQQLVDHIMSKDNIRQTRAILLDHISSNNPDRTIEEVEARVDDIMDYHLGKDLTEFSTGVIDGHTGIASVLKQMVIPGKKLTLWDKFRNLFSRSINKRMATPDKKLIDAYLESLVATTKRFDQATTTGTKESGSLLHTMWAVTGKKVVAEDLTEENLPYFRVIDDYFNSKRYPETELRSAVNAVKGLKPTEQSTADDAITDGMIRKAQAYANRLGLSYDEMSPIEQTKALANSILDAVKRDAMVNAEALHNVALADIRKIANDEDPGAVIDVGDSAAQILMSVRSIRTSKQAGEELRNAIGRGPDGYLERMAELYGEIAAVDPSPETKANWEKATRDLWRIAHNTVPVIPLRMIIGMQEVPDPTSPTGWSDKIVYKLGEVHQETTTQGKVHRSRQAFGGMAAFGKQLAKESVTKNWAKSPAMRMMIESIANVGTTFSIHETLSIADGNKKGMNAPDPKALVEMQERLLRGGTGVGKNGSKYAFIMSGGNPIIFDVTRLADYVLGDKTKVAQRINELHDANIWRMLDSHHLHQDGVTDSRYGDMPLMFDATKVHDLMNIAGRKIETIDFDEIAKKSFKERQTKEAYNKAVEEFDKQKLAGHPLVEAAELIKKMHQRVDGTMFKPFALQTEGNLLSVAAEKGRKAKERLDSAIANVDPDPIRQERKVRIAQAEYDKAKKEYIKQKATTDELIEKRQYQALLTQINATLHWAVDPAGAQYVTFGEKALPKIGEKYYGVVSAPYQSYKTWQDVTIGAGRDWATKTDEDLLNLHSIHTKDDGTKFIKWAVVDADLLGTQKQGTTRMYRAHSDPGKYSSPAPEWANEAAKNDKGAQSRSETQGRWFYSTLEEANAHREKFGEDMVSYTDIPTQDVEKYNARNHPAAGGYGKDGNEYLLPSELASKLTPVGMHEALKELFGKSGTDGSMVVFHEGNFDFLRHASGKDDAGHVKTALATYEDGMTTINKGDTHYYNINRIKEIAAKHPYLAPTAQRFIGIADNLKREGIFGLAFSTTIKGKGTYTPKADGDFLLDNQRKVIGLRQADGTYKLDKEQADMLNVEAQTKILTGQGIDKFSILPMDLHGDNAIQFVSASSANDRSESPSLGVKDLARIVSSEWGDAVRPHLDAFFDNKFTEIDDLLIGYNTADRLAQSAKNAMSDAEAKKAGSFLKQLARYVESREENAYSGVSEWRRMSDDLHAAVDTKGHIIPEKVAGLMMHPGLLYKRPSDGFDAEADRSMVDSMVAEKVKKLRYGRDVGMTATVNADLTGAIDHQYMVDYLKENGRTIALDAEGMPRSIDEASGMYMLSEFNELGTYADNSQGVTISVHDFEKLNAKSIANGTGELTLGSLVFLVTTPYDDISSFAPFRIMGLTDTANTISANKKYILGHTGKDFDGDVVGMFINSKAWQSNGVDHFSELHKKMTALGVHKGMEKAEQGKVIDGATKFSESGLPSSRIMLADGSFAKNVKPAISPLDPNHNELLAQTTRNVGVTVKKLEDISQAIQNTWGKFRIGDLGIPELKGRSGLRIVFNEALMDNNSYIKQLGAVDMYVPHGFDMDDVIYGTYIYDYKGTKWSELGGKERKEAMRAFDEYVKTASGKTVKQILAGEKPNKEKIAAHKALIHEAVSTDARMLDLSLDRFPGGFKATDAYEKVTAGIDALQGDPELAKYYERANKIIDKVANTIHLLFNKPNAEKHEKINYFKEMVPLYFDRQSDGGPQEKEVQIGMLTQYYHAIQSSADVPVVATQLRYNEIPEAQRKNMSPEDIARVENKYSNVRLTSDRRGAKLTDGDASFYIRDVVKKDGTLDSDFVAFLEKNGVTPNILFHREVKQAFKVPSLSLADADFIKGAVYGNIAHEVERASQGVTNAGMFAGFAMTAPMKDTKGKVSGSYINHQGDNMLKSDPLQIIAGAESTGVVPITPSRFGEREKLRDYLMDSVQSQAFGERESGSLDFTVWRNGSVKEWSDNIGKLNDINWKKAEDVRKGLRIFEAATMKHYGKKMTPEDTMELMAILDPTAFQQMLEKAKVSGTKDETDQNVLSAFIQIDNSLREKINANDVRKAGGLRQAVYNFLAKNSLFDVDSSNRVIEKMDPNQVALMGHEVAAPLISINNGVAKVGEIVFGEIFRDRLQPNIARFASAAYKNYIAPRTQIGQQLDMYKNKLNEGGELSRLIGSKGDHMKMLKAVIRGLVPEIRMDWNNQSNGVASSKVEGTVTIGNPDNPLIKFTMGTNSTDLLENLSLIDKLPIGKTIGATYAKVKYGRNYTPETDTSLRNTFITHVDPEGGLWNATSGQNEIVAGEAFAKARDRAIMTGADLNLFDIASQTWYRLLGGEKLVPLSDSAGNKRVDIKSFDPNAFAEGNFHITSKLENHEVLSQVNEHGVYEHHETVDRVLRENGAVLPQHERTEATEEAFVTEPFAESPEDQQAIRDAIKQHIYASMIAKGHEMAEITKLEHYKFVLARYSDMPEHVEKLLIDKIAQTEKEIAKHSTMDMSGVVSAMSRVSTDKSAEAIKVLKMVLKEMNADSVNADKLIRLLYDDVDGGAGRTEMLQRKKEVESIMTHIVGKLEDKEGIARTIDLYKQDSGFKGSKSATFGEAEIFHALGREDLLSINTANMIDRYQHSLKDAHATMDHVFQEMYSKNRSPNEIAHKNITKMLNVSLKNGALPSASHDVAAMNRDVASAMQTKETYHALDPGTNITVQALNNQKESQLIQGNYAGDVRLKILDGEGNLKGYQPTMIIANGNRITLVSRKNLQSLKSAVHTVNNNLTRNFIKDWARSEEMTTFLKDVAEKHSIIEDVSDSQYGKFVRRSVSGDIKKEAATAIKTIHELDENKAKLLDHLYSAGAFWQTAAGYLHLEQVAVIAPMLFINPRAAAETLGYAVGKWATPIIQNYFGWDGLYKGRTDNVNPIGIIKGYLLGHKLDEEGERRLSFWNVSKKENVDRRDIEAASGAHKARLDELGGGGGFMELVGSTPEQVAALRDIQGNKDNTNATFTRWGKGAWLEHRIRTLQKKLQEQFNPHDVFMPGVMDMTKEVNADLLKDFKKHKLSIRMVDGQVKVYTEGKSVDEIATLRLSALTALTAASTLYRLQATEKSGSDRAATFNAAATKMFANDYNDWTDAKKANYQRAALNYSQGNYSGKNADQMSGLGKTMSIYKTYGQERKVDLQLGVAERYRQKAAAEAMLGTGKDMSSFGVKLPDPNKQLMSILFRGLAGAALNEIFAKMIGYGGYFRPLSMAGQYAMGDAHVIPEFMAQVYNIYQVLSGKDILGNDREEKEQDKKVYGTAVTSVLRNVTGGYGYSNIETALGAGVNYLADKDKNANLVEHAAEVAKPLANMSPIGTAVTAVPKIGAKVKKTLERED